MNNFENKRSLRNVGDGRPTFAQDSMINWRVEHNCSCDVVKVYTRLIFR